MPFKSASQHRLFRAKEAAGELPKGTSDRWEGHTDNITSLPERTRYGKASKSPKKRRRYGEK